MNFFMFDSTSKLNKTHFSSTQLQPFHPEIYTSGDVSHAAGTLEQLDHELFVPWISETDAGVELKGIGRLSQFSGYFNS